MNPNTPMEIEAYHGNNGGDLSVPRSAVMVFKEAEMVAKPWAIRVRKMALLKKIGPAEHLYIEAWQMLGACYRVTTKIESTKYVDMGNGVHGYEAVASAYHMPSGAEIGRAEAMCLSDEENWGNRPKYDFENGKRKQVGWVPTPLQQIRSMAQTRAASKVLANLFKWVARMEGFQGTPAEDMTGNEPGAQTDEKPPIQDPQRKTQPSPDGQQAADGQQQQQQGNNDGVVISEKQSNRLYAICKGAGMDNPVIKSFLKQFGFERTDEVTKDRYEAICGAAEKIAKEMGAK